MLLIVGMLLLKAASEGRAAKRRVAAGRESDLSRAMEVASRRHVGDDEVLPTYEEAQRAVLGAGSESQRTRLDMMSSEVNSRTAIDAAPVTRDFAAEGPVTRSWTETR